MFGADDTIAAISTAAGSAARAIVRLSGPDAERIAAAVFTPTAGSLADTPGFRAADGRVDLSGGAELPTRAYVFRAPRSYTRQDVIELHVPGPSAVATAVLAAMIDAGARSAGPGEFTQRAFLAGRIDLSAAEAVADVIDAADDAQLRSAVATLTGRLGRLCAEQAGRITDILASVEASIDLADEDIRLDEPGELAERLDAIAARLASVADAAAAAPESAELPRVVLAGRANAGKSSLLNALSGTDRAIVAALAGTTRDVLTARTDIAGRAVLLQDAAGFAHTDDPLEAAAHAAARSAVAGADAVLFVVDLSAGAYEPDRELLDDVRAVNRRAPRAILANKCDLTEVPDAVTQLASGQEFVLPTSAVTGEGGDDLRRMLAEMLELRAGRSGEAMGLHQRQERCLQAAASAAGRARDLLADAADVADVAELAAVELRGALGEIGQISGEVVTEDVLGRIFARFCVGK